MIDKSKQFVALRPQAKNAMSDDATKQSKTARVVIGLQRLLPSAKVLYCSATGVSAVQNLAYMERLGNFGFENNKELIDSLRKAGLGAMEAFSMGLRATGKLFIAMSSIFTQSCAARH